jgi:transposase
VLNLASNIQETKHQSGQVQEHIAYVFDLGCVTIDLNQSICGRQRTARYDRTGVALVAASRSGYIVRTWREPMLWETRFR